MTTTNFPSNVHPKAAAGFAGAGVGGLIIAILESIGGSGVIDALPGPLPFIVRLAIPAIIALATAYWKKDNSVSSRTAG